jgi:hypothetical protein
MKRQDVPRSSRCTSNNKYNCKTKVDVFVVDDGAKERTKMQIEKKDETLGGVRTFARLVTNRCAHKSELGQTEQRPEKRLETWAAMHSDAHNAYVFPLPSFLHFISLTRVSLLLSLLILTLSFLLTLTLVSLHLV